MRVAALLLFALAAGCNLYHGGDGPLVDDEPDAEPPPSCDPYQDPACDPTCHWDCFGEAACDDGVATSYLSTPVPCWEWEGSCPAAERVICADGCEIERARWYEAYGNADASRLCREHPTARVGDPCVDDLDCRPTRLEPQPDGSVAQTYLRCDDELDACVEVGPPGPAGYGVACPGVASAVGPGGQGVAYRNGEVCLVVDVPGDCTYVGHTRGCMGDWECPAGSSCDDGLERVVGDGVGDSDGVCRPGLRGTPLTASELAPVACAGG